jgi:hypothetical protein
MKKIIFVASIFILISCENKDRLEEIKAELKSKDKKEDKKSEEGQKKVSFSAPPQNEKIQAPEEFPDNEAEYSEEDFSDRSYQYEGRREDNNYAEEEVDYGD